MPADDIRSQMDPKRKMLRWIQTLIFRDEDDSAFKIACIDLNDWENVKASWTSSRQNTKEKNVSIHDSLLEQNKLDIRVNDRSFRFYYAPSIQEAAGADYIWVNDLEAWMVDELKSKVDLWRVGILTASSGLDMTCVCPRYVQVKENNIFQHVDRNIREMVAEYIVYALGAAM